MLMDSVEFKSTETQEEEEEEIDYSGEPTEARVNMAKILLYNFSKI